MCEKVAWERMNAKDSKVVVRWYHEGVVMRVNAPGSLDMTGLLTGNGIEEPKVLLSMGTKCIAVKTPTLQMPLRASVNRLNR